MTGDVSADSRERRSAVAVRPQTLVLRQGFYFSQSRRNRKERSERKSRLLLLLASIASFNQETGKDEEGGFVAKKKEGVLRVGNMRCDASKGWAGLPRPHKEEPLVAPIGE